MAITREKDLRCKQELVADNSCPKPNEKLNVTFLFIYDYNVFEIVKRGQHIKSNFQA